MDAITLLRDDHQKVRKLFREFEGASEESPATKRRIVDQIVEELTVHAFIEEQLFYPAVKHLQPEGGGEAPEDLVKEAEEEHAQVKLLLAELETMGAEEEYFDAKVTVVIDDVTHHAEEEEKEMFPKVREAMGRNDLQDLGQRMLELKETAPRLPSQEAGASSGS
jgi:hemerythrin superfamily protein